MRAVLVRTSNRMAPSGRKCTIPESTPSPYRSHCASGLTCWHEQPWLTSIVSKLKPFMAPSVGKQVITSCLEQIPEARVNEQSCLVQWHKHSSSSVRGTGGRRPCQSVREQGPTEYSRDFDAAIQGISALVKAILSHEFAACIEHRKQFLASLRNVIRRTNRRCESLRLQQDAEARRRLWPVGQMYDFPTYARARFVGRSCIISMGRISGSCS